MRHKTTLEQRIQEIEARLKAATPGPWFVAEQPFDDRSTAIYGDNKAQVACDPHGARFVADCDVTMEWTEGELDQSIFDRANARLIAHAPSDLAFLSKALKVACEALEDCTGGDLASGEGIYKAHVAQGALAEIERLAKGTYDER